MFQPDQNTENRLNSLEVTRASLQQALAAMDEQNKSQWPFKPNDPTNAFYGCFCRTGLDRSDVITPALLRKAMQEIDQQLANLSTSTRQRTEGVLDPDQQPGLDR